MKKIIDTDVVLDLIMEHQTALAGRIDGEIIGTRTYDKLWQEYKAVSILYDDVRRASNDS